LCALWATEGWPQDGGGAGGGVCCWGRLFLSVGSRVAGVGRKSPARRPPAPFPPHVGTLGPFLALGEVCLRGRLSRKCNGKSGGWLAMGDGGSFTGELPMGPHAARRSSAKARGMRLILMAHFALVVRKRSQHRVHSLVDKNHNRYRL